MAKSKKSQVVSESSLLQNGTVKLAERKQKKADVMSQMQACLLNDKYSHFYVYKVHNFKAALFQRMRLDVAEHSRLFFSKNRLLAAAFKGRSDAEAIKNALSGPLLGIAFTNDSKALEEYVQNGQVIGTPGFAKSGIPATQSIILPAGPLCRLDNHQPVSSTLETYARQECGLSTTLKGGNIILNDSHTVCVDGEPLTSQSAKLLRLLGFPMASFGIELIAKYSI